MGALLAALTATSTYRVNFDGYRCVFNANTRRLVSVAVDAPLAFLHDLSMAGRLEQEFGGPATFGHVSYVLPESTAAQCRVFPR